MSDVLRGGLVLFLLALSLASASSGKTTQIESARKAEVDRIGAYALSKMIMSFCDGSQQPDAPSTHVATAGGVSARQACGMVTVEILFDGAVATFVEKVCGGADGPECAQRHSEMFFARLQERYAFTDWGQVLNKCKAYPIECQKWMSIEFWVTESHNQGVLEWARSALAQTNAQYQAAYEQAYQEERERRQRIGAAIQAFGAALAPKPTVHCTTNTYGTMATTTCQ